MKKYFTFRQIRFAAVVIFLLHQINVAVAQREKFWGVEAGFDAFGSSFENDYIRKEFISQYPDSYGIKSNLAKSFIGAKIELQSTNTKFGLSAGLRYTHITSAIYSDDFFYLLYNQDGTTTEYMRMEELTQRSDYLGIPIDLRHFVYRQRNLMFYFKAGIEFSYRIYTKKDATFYDQNMKPYEEDVVGLIETPRAYYTMFNFATGVKITGKPEVNLEIGGPSSFLSNNATGLVRSKTGGGFHASIALPF